MIAVLQEVAIKHGAVEKKGEDDEDDDSDTDDDGGKGKKKKKKKKKKRNKRKTMTADLGGKVLSAGSFKASNLPPYLKKPKEFQDILSRVARGALTHADVAESLRGTVERVDNRLSNEHRAGKGKGEGRPLVFLKPVADGNGGDDDDDEGEGEGEEGDGGAGPWAFGGRAIKTPLGTIKLFAAAITEE